MPWHGGPRVKTGDPQAPEEVHVMSDADRNVPAEGDANEPTPEERAVFERWMAVEVPVADVDAALDKFRAHMPPLTDRDVGCLAIIEIEGRHLRPLIPDDRPDEDYLAMLRAVIALQQAHFPHVPPLVLRGDLGRWHEDVIALRNFQHVRLLDAREDCVLRLYEATVMEWRTDAAALVGDLRWAVRSARKRATRHAAGMVRDGDVVSAVGDVLMMHRTGTNVWCPARKGKHCLDKRALRDGLVPEFKPAAPPAAGACATTPDETPARDPARTIERLSLFRDLRDILDRFRDRPGCVAALGHLLGRAGFGDEMKLLGLPPGGYPSEKDAAAAHDVTREAVRHGRRLIEPEIARLLAG